MLKHTFIHIQGIGEKTEQYIWRKGIYSWEQFLEAQEPLFSQKRDTFIRKELEESFKHLDDIGFFHRRFSSSDMWRLFSTFKHKAAYLDIETSGGYMGVDDITVIGIYDGKSVRSFVNGINLQEFEVAIPEYELLVTFNGASFDLPFIRRYFPGISLPKAHIDLRFLLRKLGYRGSLKKIEKEFGLKRASDIEGMDGFDAVKLWRAYQWGDHSSLDLLLHYNTADTVNLEPLMEKGFELMKKRLLSKKVFAVGPKKTGNAPEAISGY